MSVLLSIKFLARRYWQPRYALGVLLEKMAVGCEALRRPEIQGHIKAMKQRCTDAPAELAKLLSANQDPATMLEKR